jgi:hypothetical protein
MNASVSTLMKAVRLHAPNGVVSIDELGRVPLVPAMEAIADYTKNMTEGKTLLTST